MGARATALLASQELTLWVAQDQEEHSLSHPAFALSAHESVVSPVEEPAQIQIACRKNDNSAPVDEGPLIALAGTNASRVTAEVRTAWLSTKEVRGLRNIHCARTRGTHAVLGLYRTIVALVVVVGRLLVLPSMSTTWGPSLRCCSSLPDIYIKKASRSETHCKSLFFEKYLKTDAGSKLNVFFVVVCLFLSFHVRLEQAPHRRSKSASPHVTRTEFMRRGLNLSKGTKTLS